MTAPMPHVWTADEYDRLPADDGVRRELVDGNLVVSPSPAHPHQKLVGRQFGVLDRRAPADLYQASLGVEVKLGDRLRFIPDVLVVTAEAGQRQPSRFMAHEVMLAVEVVSPSTRTMDRFAKPAHYANAGIPFYWRVELDDEVRLIAHENTGGTYRVVGEFTGAVDLEVPWRINFDLAELAA
jgi:Uma2 family endonuclease